MISIWLNSYQFVKIKKMFMKPYFFFFAIFFFFYVCRVPDMINVYKYMLYNTISDNPASELLTPAALWRGQVVACTMLRSTELPSDCIFLCE